MPTEAVNLCCTNATFAKYGQGVNLATPAVQAYLQACWAAPAAYGCAGGTAASTTTTASAVPSGPGSSLYQFALAALVLWLCMRYLPHGVEIGIIILAGMLLATPNAGQDFSKFLHFVQTGKTA